MEPVENAQQKPKKSRKGLIIGCIVAFFAVMGIVGAATDSGNANNNSSQPTTTTTNIPAASTPSAPQTTAQTTPTETPKATATPTPAPAAAPVAAPTPAPAPILKSCPDGYYLNVDNNCIQSPVTAPSAPAGATAKCNDGTYSFSQHRSGTCSHHDGVAEWL